MRTADVLARAPLVLEPRARERYPGRLPPRWDQVGYRSIFAAQSSAAPAAWVD